jgi:hypothetical protein
VQAVRVKPVGKNNKPWRQKLIILCNLFRLQDGRPAIEKLPEIQEQHFLPRLFNRRPSVYLHAYTTDTVIVLENAVTFLQNHSGLLPTQPPERTEH